MEAGIITVTVGITVIRVVTMAEVVITVVVIIMEEAVPIPRINYLIGKEIGQEDTWKDGDGYLQMLLLLDLHLDFIIPIHYQDKSLSIRERMMLLLKMLHLVKRVLQYSQ